METDINGFIQQYLNCEIAYSYLDRIKATIEASNPAWGQSLREGFQLLLQERRLSRGQYCDLTFIEFENDDELYDYLQQVYQFFFLGGEEAPIPPD